jgi:hypothetical protein
MSNLDAASLELSKDNYDATPFVPAKGGDGYKLLEAIYVGSNPI